MIKIFVGTCSKNKKAEIALINSIALHTKSKYKIVWMRDSEEFQNWNKTGWGTGFTPFRWIVPELCRFSGKAIYMDVDVILTSDIKELWDMKIPKNKAIISLPGNYSVMLMDCKKMSKLHNTQPISEWKKHSCNPPFKGLYSKYVDELEAFELIKPLPPEWNCLDGENCKWNEAKLIHFTKKDTQPWKPYPKKHKYKPHELKKLWEFYYKCGIIKYSSNNLA
jgi:hypothetical protein